MARSLSQLDAALPQAAGDQATVDEATKKSAPHWQGKLGTSLRNQNL